MGATFFPFGALTALPALLRHPRAAREDVVSFQADRLRRIVAHAYERVRYYRTLFDRSGVEPRHIQSVADLQRVPISSREDIQRLPVADIVARGLDPARLLVHRTSGSSGTPLTIRRTWLEERLLAAFRLRAAHHFGMRPTDRRVQIVSVPPPDPADGQLPLRLLQASGIYRIRQIDCLLEPQDIIRSLRADPPDVVMGLPGVLTRVALGLDDDDRRLVRPRLVSTGGEVLTPLMRRQISAGFRTPVFETYGSHEFNVLAWECKDSGEYHVSDDSIVLEVLNGDRPAAVGERGEVVATSLYSWAMPFIRYRLGDVVTRGADVCVCGQPFSTISAIQGRMIDYFRLPDGRQVHPYEIVSLVVRGAPWIQQYRLIQHQEDRVRLEAVASQPPSSDDLTRLQERVGDLLGPRVEFAITLVPQISLEPNGKFRVSRSFVNSRYDDIDWDRL
jgi:phenylacetate-CoA ligase